MLVVMERTKGNVVFGPGFTSGTLSVVANSACGSSLASVLALTTSTAGIPGTPGLIIGAIYGLCSSGNSSAIFSISEVGGATSYFWTAPLGASIDSGQGTKSVKVSFTSSFISGYLSVIATNATGSSAARLKSLRSVTATPGIITGTTSGLCTAGTSSATYSIVTVPGAESYTWTVPTGASISSGQGTNSVTGDFSSSFSSGNIYVKANNACGSSAVRALALKSVPTPGIITGATSACAGSNGDYTIVPIAGVTSYTWSISGDATVSGTGTTGSVVFGPNFTSGVLSVIANNVCGSGAARAIAIYGVPSIPGIISGTSSGLCPAGITSVIYSVANVRNASSYTWTVPPGATITSGNGTNQISVNFDSNFSSGTILVSANNACGLSGERKLALTSAPAIPGIVTGQTSDLCVSGTASAVYSIAPVNGATSYTWTAPGGASITSGNGTTAVTISFSNDFTSGNLIVVANNVCGSSLSRITLLRSVPSSPGLISGITEELCPNGILSTAYSIRAVAGASSYTWTVPSGVTINNGQGDTLINVSFGSSFTVGYVAVSADNNCGNSPVRKLGIRSFPSNYSPITGPTSGMCPSGITSASYYVPAIIGASAYSWTVPAEVTINSGQGDTLINVSFGSSFFAGNLSVSASNVCGSNNPKTLAISSIPYNDGTITGNASVCTGARNIAYSIDTIAGAQSYAWTVPDEATVTSGQGTNSITVDFGNSGGNLCVTASNACGTSFSLCSDVAIASCKTASDSLAVKNSSMGKKQPAKGKYFNENNLILFDETVDNTDAESEAIFINEEKETEINSDIEPELNMEFIIPDDIIIKNDPEQNSEPEVRDNESEEDVNYESNEEQDIESLNEESIAPKSELAINAYPNPTTGILNISVAGISMNEQIYIEIYDISGRLIYSFKEEDLRQNKIITFNELGKFPKGIYSIRFILGDEELYTKVVVE